MNQLYQQGLSIRFLFILWLCLFALLLGIHHEIFFAIHIESGDGAANSLLIQQAKTFNLLTGNYSRIGFYHPGPAILYVLAAGEFLFFDWLSIVPSPFSGQLIAVVIYNAFFITLFFNIQE